MKRLALSIWLFVLFSCSGNGGHRTVDTLQESDQGTFEPCWSDLDCKNVTVPQCKRVFCDLSTGLCTLAPDDSQQGKPCNDHDSCTIGDTCIRGVCTGTTFKTCDDGNPCTRDYCDPGAGCVHEPANEGQDCDGHNPCIRGEKCRSGKCMGGQMVCLCNTDLDCVQFEDNNLCNGLLQCDPSRHVCIPAPGSVIHCRQPANTCLHAACAPATGKCVVQPVADGTACDDFDPCTYGDKCVNGQCVGQDLCNDHNECTVDRCDRTLGTCTHDPAPMDGHSCGTNRVCLQGSCVAMPDNSDDVDGMDVPTDAHEVQDTQYPDTSDAMSSPGVSVDNQ